MGHHFVSYPLGFCSVIGIWWYLLNLENVRCRKSWSCTVSLGIHIIVSVAWFTHTPHGLPLSLSCELRGGVYHLAIETAPATIPPRPYHVILRNYPTCPPDTKWQIYHVQSTLPAHLWSVGGSRSTGRKPTPTRGERANSTQTVTWGRNWTWVPGAVGHKC